MKAIKFKLLFEGHETEMSQIRFEISHGENQIDFRTEELREIDELKGGMSTEEFDSMKKYFDFYGFSLYFIQRKNDIFLFLYRFHRNRHELYERGVWQKP